MAQIPTKAIGSAGGVTVGGAISTVIIELWWPTASASAAVALTTIATAALAYLGAYLPRMERRR